MSRDLAHSGFELESLEARILLSADSAALAGAAIAPHTDHLGGAEVVLAHDLLAPTHAGRAATLIPSYAGGFDLFDGIGGELLPGGDGRPTSFGPPEDPSAAPALRAMTERSRAADTVGVTLNGGTSWQALGPSGMSDGQVEGLTPQGNPISGAVNALVMHPGDPNLAFLASPNGGIWKSTNFRSTADAQNPAPPNQTVPIPSATWSPVSDQLGGQSYTALALSDNDANPANGFELYAGGGNSSSSHTNGFLTAD